MTRSAKVMLAVVVGGVLLVVGGFALGRLTAPDSGPAGQQSSAYFDGLRAGEAQGRQEGRALQEGEQLSRGQRKLARHAFNAGYVAGVNDAFAGYDGGWALHVPWIITLDQGTGQASYRIHDREQLEAGVDYYLCPDGHSVCRRPHR